MASYARPRSPLSCLTLLAVTAAGGSVGCQFNPGGATGGPGGTPLDGQPPPPDDARLPADGALPAPDGSLAPDASPLPPLDTLVSRGLLTRYFIDEAGSGSSVLRLEDAAPAPLPLDITITGGEFVDDGGNRGLRWNAIVNTAIAKAAVLETGKIWQALDGSTTGTIELVVDVDAFLDSSRLSHLAQGEDPGLFSLRVEDIPEGLDFVWNNDLDNRNTWAVDVRARNRIVLHLVFDSDRLLDSERVRLYVDGVEQAADVSNPPGPGETIEIIDGTNPVYALGNRETGGRGVQGTFYYAALYSSALEPLEVTHNQTILRLNDDGPGR
jgi:hypothetical protein